MGLKFADIVDEALRSLPKPLLISVTRKAVPGLIPWRLRNPSGSSTWPLCETFTVVVMLLEHALAPSE